MKITGHILKENREKKGISLSEVAIATKINVKTLQAMEEGDLTTLPPKTFLRGFVRSYASYLELDVDAITKDFFDEMGSTKPKASPTMPSSGSYGNGSSNSSSATPANSTNASTPARAKPHPSEAHEAINPRSSLAVKVGGIAGIILLILLIVTIKNKMENYQKETVVEAPPQGLSAVNSGAPVAPSDAVVPGASPSESPAPSPSASPAAAVAPSPSPSPSASPTATPAVTPTPAATATPTPTPTPSPTPSPTPTPTAKPTATPTPVPTASPATPAAAAAAAVPVASPTPAAKPGRGQEVIIEALDALDVDAQIDDEPTKKIRLKGDQVQTIKAKRKVILRFSDGGAVNLIVNGNERGVPGDLGKPARIELP